MPCIVDEEDESNLPTHQDTVKSYDEDPAIPTRSLEDYLYLKGTRHQDDEDELIYETISVEIHVDELSKERFIVGYRKRVLRNGRLSNEIDGPIHIRDIERLTTAYAKEVVHVDLGVIDLLNNTDNDPAVTTYQDKTGISNAGATSVYEHIDEDDRRQDKRRRIDPYDYNPVRTDGLCIKDQVGRTAGIAYEGYAASDVLLESGVMESGGRTPIQSSNRSGDTNNSSSSSNSSCCHTVEDDVREHQYNKDDFTGLPSSANSVIDQYLPSSKGYSFRETVLNMLDINSMLNRKMRRLTSDRLTRYAKQGDPVAAAICALQLDPKLLDAYKNGYREPKDHNEAMSTEDRDKWLEAEQQEIHSMLKNKVYEFVNTEPTKKPIPCKWVYKRKRDSMARPEIQGKAGS